MYYEGYSNDASTVDEASSAAYPSGADDVQLAREWVYDNIESDEFGGGCVDKVVLFGHSSGGAHIAMNLYAAGTLLNIGCASVVLSETVWGGSCDWITRSKQDLTDFWLFYR